MPALVRLLPASLCLLVAPFVVMAGEFPQDTNTITSLTVEQAKQLVESFPGVQVHVSGIGYRSGYQFGLPLRGLRELDVDVAKVLAKNNTWVLVLDGLTALDPECAKALAEFKGDLVLNGLATLDAATAGILAAKPIPGHLFLGGIAALDAHAAEALSKFKGNDLWLEGLATLDAATARALAEFQGRHLALAGLTTLDAATAKALAAFKGDSLLLNGLTTLDAETAKALAEFKGDLGLNGLERASFGAVRVLRNRSDVYMPNPWYLLRYQIAALIGTVVFVIMAGIVVWHSRRQRAAG